LPSDNRTLDVKAADARESERLIYIAWRGTTARAQKFRCGRAKCCQDEASCY